MLDLKPRKEWSLGGALHGGTGVIINFQHQGLGVTGKVHAFLGLDLAQRFKTRLLSFGTFGIWSVAPAWKEGKNVITRLGYSVNTKLRAHPTDYSPISIIT